MRILSLNAFTLGVVILISLCLSNFIYSWLCTLWQIKIKEFAILTNSWFSLHSTDINGVKYILGWLPLGSHITPLGMLEEDISNGSIAQEDLPYTFLSKSKQKQKIFRFSPYILWIILALIALYFVSPASHNILTNMIMVESYVFDALKTMLFSFHSKNEFVSITQTMFNGKSKLLITLLILLNFQILFLPLGAILRWFADEKKKSTLGKFVGFILTIGILYITLWRIPSFVISFFPILNFLRYFFSVVLGMYCAALVIYFSIILLVRINSPKILS